ncbi:progranulin [Caerostris darwini]|uniref:Progranulin n=1 Tax=Caerostris darwini TaxID=1538125 RepID=A0AAV4NPF3_9ARAC|nr:progranulin [Caerostris darwini]
MYLVTNQPGEIKMRAFIALVFAVMVCGVYSGDCPQELCSDQETCCNGPSQGLYGCCPAPNAVCCTDGLHCCPENTVCNLTAGTCDDKSGKRVPFDFRRKTVDKPSVVYCPDGQSFCDDTNTCCMMPTGMYGCCPYPNAVCCNDGLHCCPSGTQCDSTYQFCLQGFHGYAALFKRPAYPLN